LFRFFTFIHLVQFSNSFWRFKPLFWPIFFPIFLTPFYRSFCFPSNTLAKIVSWCILKREIHQISFRKRSPLLPIFSTILFPSSLRPFALQYTFSPSQPVAEHADCCKKISILRHWLICLFSCYGLWVNRNLPLDDHFLLLTRIRFV
jgi:hypothetical protein